MTTPELSVVLAATTDERYLGTCLDALVRQAGDVSAEVIVCARSNSPSAQLVDAKYPEVRLIVADQLSSVAELRALGVRAAYGRLIAITEDHCIPPPDWFVTIRQAHVNHLGPAIGGAVDNGATERLVDWAVFFCEYSNFMSPAPRGIVHDLPGPNVSYKREALVALDVLTGTEFWETVVHGQVERAGETLWSDPSIRMLHRKHFATRSFLAERYHYSRSFAGRCAATISPMRRLGYTLLTPLLPPLLVRRISQRVLSRRRYTPIFLRTLPYLVLFTLVWAWGEAVGYLLGPGHSAIHLE